MATQTHADSAALGSRAVELLQRLIRFDTVNPPGNEGEAQRFLLRRRSAPPAGSARSSPRIPERPNLVARLRGAEDGPEPGPDLPRGHGPGRPGRVDPRPLGRRPRRRLRLGPRRARHEGPGGLGDRRLPGSGRGGMEAGPRRHAAGGQRRRGDRRSQRGDVALRGASGEGPLRHGPQRGRRARGLLRGQALLHRSRSGRRASSASGCGPAASPGTPRCPGSATTRC